MKIFSGILLSLLMLALPSCAEEKDYSGHYSPNQDNGEIETDKEIVEFKALVYANEEVVNDLYGGTAQFNLALQQLFTMTTDFWNNSNNKFNYYFKFTPAGLILYPTAKYFEARAEASEPLDSKYDYVLLFNLDAESTAASCGGSNGHAIVFMNKPIKTQKEEGLIHKDNIWPDASTGWKLGTYSVLGHEYGHFRGATDLYQYPIVRKAHNPINGELYSPQRCNMGTGTGAWSDYCSAVFNYTAKYKRLPSSWSADRFPEAIELKVSREGKPVANATVKLYGCRGGGGEKGLSDGDNGPDVYKEPFRVYTTNASGIITISDPYRLYQVDFNDPANKGKLPEVLPWGYWFNFLIEATDEDGNKAYIWMPDLDIQQQHLEEGNSVYHNEIVFK